MARLKDFTRSGHPRTLLASFLYFDISFMVWLLMGVLGVSIAKDLDLSAAQKGLLAAIPILGGSLVRIPMGFLVDRIGPKKTGIIAQTLVMVPLAGAWLCACSFSTVLTFGFLLGIAGGSFAVALPLASRWYPPQHQGMAMGIAGAGNSGTVLASLFAPRLAAHFGWHNVFGFALLPVFGALLVFLFLAKESPHVRATPKRIERQRSLWREPDTAWFSLFYGITFGGFVGLASFLGIFFHDQYGLSKVMAGNFTALCVLAGSFCRPIGGYLADKLGGIRVLSVVFGLAGAFLLGVGFLPPLQITAPLLLLAVTCLGMGNGAVFQLVPQRFKKEIGAITGIVGAAGGLGGFLLPTILGFFKQVGGSYGIGFTLLACSSLGALALLRIIQRGWFFSWSAREPALMGQAT